MKCLFSRLSRPARRVAAASLLACLAACGYKGPLYLPPPPPQHARTPPPPNDALTQPPSSIAPAPATQDQPSAPQ
jgi:predicted small lipoprotein YifL